MGGWTYIIIEAFCGYESLSKKYWTFTEYDLDKMKPIGKPKKERNKLHIHHSKRPKWCRLENNDMVPQPRCYQENCPFLLTATADVEEISENE